MASYRGPNVSILHLRSTSEPWDNSSSVVYATTSRVTSASSRSTVNRFPGKTNSLRREPVQAQGSLVVTGTTGSGRELSPVRWCDREVDGVYLGRSGWVQVQQRSLDDNRRVSYTPPKPPVAVSTSHNMPPPPRLKMSDFHSRSEPGKFPSVEDGPQQRPGFLPLPNEPRRTREKPSPSSLDLSHEDPITPPPITPIISPPPAFQDTNKRFLTTATTARNRTISRSPVLTRSNAIESSPPPSPPPTLNWSSTLPTHKVSPISTVPMRPRRLTPSPVSTPQQHGLPQTKSLEDACGIRRTVFQKYDSSSSSSSSFGFRSLDSNLGARIGMPRLTETDSSLGGYEDGDEEDNLSSSLNLSGYSSVTMVNSSPDTIGFHSIIPAVERVSPSSLRGRQLHRQMRRSPGSDGSNKKLGSNQVSPTSSSSSSSSRSPSAGPFRRSGSHNKPVQHHREHVTATWDGRGSRVRRSRSLQLPERKSPASSGGASPAGRPDLGPGLHRDYYHGKQEPRVVVKINGEQPLRTKRHGLQRTTQSEELQRERERGRDDELRREAEEEARVVTEFLYGARSREAARALIMQRCLEQRSPEPPAVGGYSSRGVQRGGLAQRPKALQRGVTTPGPAANTHFCPNPCNPSTCDFWPHCAHRDGIYTTTTTKSTTPLATSPQPPAAIRLSQSYPNTVNHSGYKERKGRDKRVDGGRNGYQSTRSSPASLERMNEHDISPSKLYPKRGNSLNVPSQEPEWRGIGLQCRQHSHLPRGHPQAPPAGLRVGLSDTSSSSMDAAELGLFRSAAVVTTAVSPDPTKASPIEVNSVIVNTGESSGSSSSSDIWVTTSDRTMTKSPRNAKSSGASTPLEEGRASKSPVRTSDDDHSRPGSAPAHQDRPQQQDTQQRSLSLPKSFQSVRDLHAHGRHSGLFPSGRRVGPEGPRSTMHSPAPALRPPTPETARTAPATPVKEIGLQDHNSTVGLTKTCRFSSTPLIDPSDSHWDRAWNDDAGNTANDNHHQKEISQSHKNISANSTESVLQKFRKSFSLRFYKKGGGSNSKDTDDDEKEPLPPESPPPETRLTPPLTKEDSSEKFRFGPLIWRTSKERKKMKKSARNAKCNSGDSGIQIEMVGRAGDSSESHDTDHMADEDTLDIDSPPVVRRRGTASSSEGKPSRPTSDVINQILIDKLKADLQARGVPRRGTHTSVRRTHSDLGGQRLFNWDMRNSYRRMLSTPSPIKMKPTVSPRRGTLETPHKRRYCGRPQQLRRSVSQPLGINELSPLMRRKPSASGRSNVLSEDERGVTSEDDELLSDSESSITSLTDRKKSFEQAMDEEVVILAEAVWDHVAMEPEELAFRAGEVIEVLDTLDRDWWWGARGDHAGWFPSAFVRLRVSQEDTVEDCLAAIASGGSKQLRRRTSISLLSNDQVRSRVVRELVNTERDFVKVLRDVKEGYLIECKKRSDMFSNEQINTIFGNTEQLLAFQEEFLEDLEQHVDSDAPHRSCLGDTFLRHQAGFRMYSEYCNSHPMAIATLQELYQHNSYSKFFEACRLMRGLIEIPLDGYLLTPVQRICKYPLQLAELLKYTKTDHPDHAKITEALEAMRGVAVLINERKRRMESLEKLAAWQQRVDGWEGEDLIETSSQLIHQGEAIRVTTGMWTNNITMFLFDHQLVYCKKDILKRNTYVYKGRLQLGTCDIINVPDGKEPSLGVSVRHGVKVHASGCVRDKWLLFCCRSAPDKTRWLEAFAEERRLVEQDLRDGLEFAPAARHLARMAAARCYRRPPNKPRSKTYKRGNSDVTMGESSRTAPVQRTNGLGSSSGAGGHGSTHSLGRRVGTWFTFGGNKKSRNLGRAATMQTVVHPS